MTKKYYKRQRKKTPKKQIYENKMSKLFLENNFPLRLRDDCPIISDTQIIYNVCF